MNSFEGKCIKAQKYGFTAIYDDAVVVRKFLEKFVIFKKLILNLVIKKSREDLII